MARRAAGGVVPRRQGWSALDAGRARRL